MTLHRHTSTSFCSLCVISCPEFFLSCWFYFVCLPPLSVMSSSHEIAFSEVSVWCHLSGKRPCMEVHPRHRKRGWEMLGWRCLEQGCSKILTDWWQAVVVAMLSCVLIWQWNFTLVLITVFMIVYKHKYDDTSDWFVNTNVSKKTNKLWCKHYCFFLQSTNEST